MRFDEFLALVKQIKNARSLDEAWEIYVKHYLKPSFDLAASVIRECGVKADLDALWRLYSEKVRELFRHVYPLEEEGLTSYDLYVRYPPEVKYLYVLAFGTRVPLMQWSTLPKEEKVPKIKQACSMLGPCVCVAFRGCGKIWMIDVDIAAPPEKKREIALEIAKIIRKLDLPYCQSWGGGLNAWIPISEKAYPKGAKLRIRGKIRDVASGYTHEVDYVFDRRSSIRIVLGADELRGEAAYCRAGIEILIDFIYVWPRQSWIWREADAVRSSETRPSEITSVTFIRKAVDKTHAVSWNWLVHGISYSIGNPAEVLRKLIEEVITKFSGYMVYGSRLVKTPEGIRVERPRILVDFEVEVEPRQVSVEEEVRGRGEEIGFREYCPTEVHVPYGGGVTYLTGEAYHETRFIYAPDYLTVYWPDQGELILHVCRLAHERDVLPHCVVYFLLVPPPGDVTKFELNVVGWFMMRQLFPVFFYEDEVKTEQGREKWRARVRLVCEQASRIKNLPLRWYYYEKFNSVGRPPSEVFLKEAHDSLMLSSVCSECPYRSICHEPRKSASAKLVNVANAVAYASFRDRELRDYLHPDVIRRILAGLRPLPRPVADNWVIRRVAGKTSG